MKSIEPSKRKIRYLPFLVFALTIVSAFTAFGSDGSVVVTGEMIEPIVEGLTATVTSILPYGMTILAVIFGVKMIPRVLYMFF